MSRVRNAAVARIAASIGVVLVAAILSGQAGLANWSGNRPTPPGGVSEWTRSPAISTRGNRPLLNPAAVSADWSTYHHDNARSGFDAAQPAFNGVTTGWASPTTVDGDVYAEPLVVGGTAVVATENNSVYGLNAATGAVLWQRNLGPPVPSSSLPCGNIDPVGITSTPVIDSTAGLIYVVGLVRPTGQPMGYVLAAIRVSDGTVSWQRALTIAGFDPTIENQRGALTLLNGTLYIPFGGRWGDCGNYHGYLFATPASSGGGITFFQASTDAGAGFWQSAGASVDTSGNFYETSGNSSDSGTYDGGETVFKLSPALAQLSYFAPSNWQSLNQTDTDLGSVGPLPVGGNRIFQVGKSGDGFLLSQANLGGIGGQLFSGRVCSQTADAAFGGAAYVAPYIFVPCANGLVALTLSQSPCGSFSIAWQGPATYATPPIVAGGLVWIMDPGGTFYALNPTTGSTVYSKSIGAAVHFATPAAGGGAVYIAASTQVYSFVSASPPGPPPTPFPNPSSGPTQWWCQPVINAPNPQVRTPWWRRL